MATSAKTTGQIKSQITRFSAKVSLGLDKPKRKFIQQMIYGIQASKDVKLTNIARALGFRSENVEILNAIDEDKDLSLVVVKGMGKEPLMLLANLIVKNTEDALGVMEIYLTRWKCEESFRFIKGAYQLEDVRLIKYEGLRNIVSLIMAVFFFISVVLGAAAKLRILLKKVYEKSKRLFEIPPFKQYAICDGIYNLLFGRKFSRQDEDPTPQTSQLWLPLNISEF